MATTLSQPRRREARGFSLVEVCLALGIVSFSLVSLIAMLPSGLGALRDSMDQTLHAQILQRVAGNLAASDYANLGDRTLYFDGEGQFLGETSSAAADALYVVRLTEAPPSLPGLTDAEEIESFRVHLKRIQVGIARANVPGAPAEWYALQVARN